MFSNLLVKTFIKDNENIENEDVRNKYGYLAGTGWNNSKLYIIWSKIISRFINIKYSYNGRCI